VFPGKIYKETDHKSYVTAHIKEQKYE